MFLFLFRWMGILMPTEFVWVQAFLHDNDSFKIRQKTTHDIIHSLLFWSLTCLFRCLGADSIPANTAQISFHVCFETKFQGREVDKNSHRNEPWIPNRFRTSCWRWQPPLSIVPWRFIRFIEFLWFIPLFLGSFANQENKTRLSVRQKTQKQQTCDFIIWSNNRQLCTETSTRKPMDAGRPAQLVKLPLFGRVDSECGVDLILNASFRSS